MRWPASASSAAPGLQRLNKAALFAAPTCSDGPTLDAPDCVADQDPPKNRADTERMLRASPCSAWIMFGGAPRVCVLAFPSPPNQVDRRVTRPRETRAPPYAPAAVKSSKMPNKMLIDATHPEETRVVVVRGNRVEEFDFETAQRKQLRGNIYLAKVTRVEPSLQAAFIEYGGKPPRLPRLQRNSSRLITKSRWPIGRR